MDSISADVANPLHGCRLKIIIHACSSFSTLSPTRAKILRAERHWTKNTFRKTRGLLWQQSEKWRDYTPRAENTFYPRQPGQSLSRLYVESHASGAVGRASKLLLSRGRGAYTRATSARRHWFARETGLLRKIPVGDERSNARVLFFPRSAALACVVPTGVRAPMRGFCTMLRRVGSGYV